MKTKTAPPTLENQCIDNLESFFKWSENKDADDVAQLLRSEGVRGNHNAGSCPIAVMLRDRLGAPNPRVGPQGYSLGFGVYNQRRRHRLPDALVEFIRKFDKSEDYLDLETEPCFYYKAKE
jgi:hypothetical protein